ncbi:DUF6693 family protein [Actinobacillus delphinicola]|uniref:Uncharacterized protein n=1 Tax=Actinobacillus delphinicola TaxID=51161 RepID=A0A448TUE3_9PAST|nr:hypothetical protein [Actinobacillus delphinicola]VEJ09408.1 Uncharacterised protein [Actinobacillus delphinicola]
MRRRINFNFSLLDAVLFSILWAVILMVTMGIAAPLFIFYLVKFFTDRMVIEDC